MVIKIKKTTTKDKKVCLIKRKLRVNNRVISLKANRIKNRIRKRLKKNTYIKIITNNF